MRAVLVVLLVILSGQARGDVRVKAFSGSPFGVAEITLDGRNSVGVKLDDLESLGNQVFYPVASEQRFTGRVSCTVRFLLVTSDPFEVELPNQYVRGRKRKTPVRMKTDPVQHAAAMQRWWRDYAARARQAIQQGRFPTSMDLYLTSMLARRLKLRAPKMEGHTFVPADFSDFVSLMTGTEAIRLAMQKDALLDTKAETVPADKPLPKPITPPPVKIPRADPETEVEPIAMVVPHECFYARFGSFRSFLWFRDRIDQWGAELRDLASFRGLDHRITDRLQKQLELPDTELSRILGPAIVKDVAVIGQDTFLREGAAIGVLFQATNNTVLTTTLKARRALVAKKDPAVVLHDVTFEGFEQTVSLLHSDDNRVRSFYARHGDFHLVTTSRNIARRFLEAAVQKKGALGASNEFLHARTVMPLEYDSVFLYLSDRFFRTFVEPQYRIEMTRRARSESEIELAQIAQLAARAEGHAHQSRADLIRGGFLPQGFGRRSDGSELILKGGEWIDTLRGRRGAFLPVPDVTLDGATPAELAAYAKFGQFYRRVWEGMDPAMVSIDRATNGRIERLVLNLHVFPIPRQANFWLLNMLQVPKDPLTVTGAKDLLVFAECYLGANPLFAGLADAPVSFSVEDDRIVTHDDVFDDWIIGNAATLMGKPPADEGLSETTEPFGNREGWQFSKTGIHIIGKSKELIASLGEKLGLEKAQRRARVRFRLGDLSESQLAPVINSGAWLEARRIVRGNTTWLRRINSQLHVDRKECSQASERILNARLVHPLGGSYAIERQAWEPMWQATPRKDYVFPPLRALKRATFELDIPEPDVLTSRVELWLRVEADEEDR